MLVAGSANTCGADAESLRRRVAGVEEELSNLLNWWELD